MEEASDFPLTSFSRPTAADSITTTTTTCTRADKSGRRAEEILGVADLAAPARIAALRKPSTVDFDPSWEINSDIVRSRLIQHRISQPGYRPPETRTLNRLKKPFRSAARNAVIFDKQKWKFNKQEVAATFNALVFVTPLPPPGIAEALLAHAGLPKDTTLNELWLQLRNTQLTRLTWLDEVTKQNNVDYIRLLCQYGVAQNELDSAFSVALSNHSMAAMAVLLSFGAAASACQNAIRERVQFHDVLLVELLLSAPTTAMSVQAWRYCIEPVVGADMWGKPSSSILLPCLAHRPDIVHQSLLLQALEHQNLEATAAILAYVCCDDELSDVRTEACGLVSRIRNDKLRLRFYTLLAKRSFLQDSTSLRQELMKNVKSRNLPLVQLLADAGVSLNIEPYNAFDWAVSRMDLDILGLFKDGKLSLPISPALELIPRDTPEPDILRLLELFPRAGLTGDPLHALLVQAVQKQHTLLVRRLLQDNASELFDNAAAIHAALAKSDFEILGILLERECDDMVLLSTLSTAMILRPRSNRLRAVQMLLGKRRWDEPLTPHAARSKLGVLLRNLLAEDGEAEVDLIRLLLQHRASPDNAVLVAARKCNVAVLHLLCEAKPRTETLAQAVPLAFGFTRSNGSEDGHQAAFNCIELLLQEGATGAPIHQTLLGAAKHNPVLL